MQPELLWVPAQALMGGDCLAAVRRAARDGRVRRRAIGRSTGPRGGLPRVAVRVRNPGKLRSAVLDAMRGALEAQWKADVGWTLERLRGESVGREEERGARGAWPAVVSALRHSRCRWRELLRPLPRSAGHGVDGLELPGRGVREAPEGRRAPLEAMEDQLLPSRIPRPASRPGMSSAAATPPPAPVHSPPARARPCTWWKPLHAESSMERAEMRARNVPWSGMRAVIPGPDGRFYGYGVSLTNLGEDNPLEGPASRCYWYYPGTVFIREGEWRPDLLASSGSPYLTRLRQSLLSEALAAATAAQPEPLLGLDYDVLALLTSEQRARVFSTLFASPALTAGGAERERVVELLVRVVLSTPAEEFPPLENMLSSSEALRKLLAGGALGLLALGEAFTLKALASPLLSFDSLDSMPSIRLGREGSTTHLLDVLIEEAWADSAKRAALRFRPVRQKFELRYSSSSERDQPSRPLHPLELVRVELHGSHPRARIMTAAELAMRASVTDTALVWAAVGRISELHILYSGVSGLARAPLATAASAAAAEGGGALAARQVAVRAFIGRTALVASMAVVDSYRDELSRTQAGRNFLAVHDFAMLALAARDIHGLATSGLLREWGQRAGTLLSEMGGRTSAGVRESVESARALAKTVERMLSEGKAVATPEGLRFPAPGGVEAFRQTYFAMRAELAAERAIGGIRAAGLEAQQAEQALGTLKRLVEESPDLASAYNAVSRRAAALPANQAQAYLAEVDALLASARPTAKLPAARLLTASGARGVANPVAFLQDARWLVQHPGLDGEALGTLALKVSKRSVDLAWLRSTGLAADDLNFLARDKNTPWKLFKKAAAQPGNRRTQLEARGRLRGIAGEMATERAARKLFPGYRIKGRQVPMGGEEGSVIDFELVATDGSIRRGVEVKGWISQTWRQALKGWQASKDATSLDAESRRLMQQLQNVSKQLKNAAKEPRGEPILMVSDQLSKESRSTLQAFLDANAPWTQVGLVSEEEMLAATRRLRAAFKLPEQLPQAAGGTP